MKIDASIFKVNMRNPSQDITKRQFSTTIDGITQTLLCNKYMGVIHILFKEHVINNCLVYR